MSNLKRRPSPALAISLIALFVALGSGAYAASKIDTQDIRKKAVTTPKLDGKAVSKQKIAGKAVTGAKVARDSIKSAKVQDESLKTDDYGPETVTEAKLAGSAVSTDKLVDDAVTTDKLASPPLFATVAPADTNPQIVRGQGAVEVTRRPAAGSFVVTFDRNVQNCTWLATYGQPDDTFVDAKFATVRGRDPVTQPNAVGVVIRDFNGTSVDGAGFHVAALCPEPPAG
jgi:hypothetical protein